MVTLAAIPDYSSQAAAELKLEAQRWAVCAQGVIDNMDEASSVEALQRHTHQLKNVAGLLGYASMRFGLTEVAELLHYKLSHSSNKKDAADYALVLLQVSDELTALTSLPAAQARRVSAVSWLPIIDNCRACRQVAALSKDVVAAAGIALPSSSKLPMPAKQDCEDFLFAIQSVHKSFTRQLMASLRDNRSVEILDGSAKTFIRLAEACQSETRLSTLEPVFRAAGVVLASVVEKPERYNMAMQRLYARIERYLAELSKMQPSLLARTRNLVPDDILRQLLFYVARFSHTSADAKKLTRDFGLHVLNTEVAGASSQDAASENLRTQVLEQVDFELNELQSWMSQAAVDPKHKTAKRLFKRLGEQHLVAGILGLSELEEGLANLRAHVRALKNSGGNPDSKLKMAEQILSVRDSLLLAAQSNRKDFNVRSVQANTVEGVAAKLKQLSRRKPKSQFYTESVQACLKAVQSELRQCEPELTALFEGNSLVNAGADDIACRIEQSAKALELLPQPEVAPLIDGLASAIRESKNNETSESYQANIAELLVALDLYLDSLILESKSLTPLLQSAVAAMQALSQFDSSSNSMGASLTQALSNDTLAITEGSSNDSNESLLDTYLMANQRITPWVSHRTDELNDILPALNQLSEAARKANLDELHELTNECGAYMRQNPLPNDARELVGETLMVVPQMLHAEPGVAETVRGLDALKARLALNNVSSSASPASPASTASTASPASASSAANAALLTSNEKSSNNKNRSLGDVSSTETDELQEPLDNTLNDVFARECTAHITTLRKAIRVARADLPLSKLPSDDMLRALHTLTGCTQTVDATNIVAVVKPLQKASLSLQRRGMEFSDADTDYIEQLADVMEARLHHFQYQNDVDPAILDIESRLPDFVAAVHARTRIDSPATTNATTNNELQATQGLLPSIAQSLLAKSNSVESNETGLSSIFRAEADDLMMRLRAHTSSLLSAGHFEDSGGAGGIEAKKAKDGALRVLHTIKGSARMSGSHAMADAAHELENDVSGVSDAKAFGEILRQKLPELQACLMPTLASIQPSALAAIPPTTVPIQASEQPSTLAVTHSSVPADTAEPKHHASTLFGKPAVDDASEELLHAGTTLVSRQAEVDGRIAHLSEHIRDIQTSALRLQRLATDNPAFDSVASKELVADIQVAQRQLDQSLQALQHVQGLATHTGTALHRALMQARLKNVDSLLPRLEAALSDATTVCNREAGLLLTGGDLPVSATLLNALAPLLDQLIRNAVAHGLDSIAVRESAQKPADGEIAITVRVEGTDLLIDVSDDGEGIDEDALNQQRIDEGLEPLRGAKHLREILCTPGYSTLDDATPVAGRGQGLSMVLDGVEALSGELGFINDPGEGLTVRLRIPQPMVVAKSLVFGEGAMLHAIPVGLIEHVVPFDETLNVIQHSNQDWPVCTIEQLMGVPSQEAVNATRCVLIKVVGENLAIPVPSLAGYKELIVQPLGSQLQSLERYVGGAVLSDGRTALILNLHRLFQLRLVNQKNSDVANVRQEPARMPTALIADDSVTMRVAGERLLQRLGFQVHTARDGLEALDFLKRSLPSVLLLDIEMPGADGFDVVRRARAKLVAAEVPVIMISTRRGPEERKRARSLGIQHLIHKPYTETRLREALEEVGVLDSIDRVN